MRFDCDVRVEDSWQLLYSSSVTAWLPLAVYGV